MTHVLSPIGRSIAEGRQARAQRSAVYRAERDRRTPYEQIAREVLRLRMEYDLTQEQLAERVGTSHSQIARIESGQYHTNVETLRRVAAAFNADLIVSFAPRSTRLGPAPSI